MRERIVIVLSPALVSYAFPGSQRPMMLRSMGANSNTDAVQGFLPQVTVQREVPVAEGIALLEVAYGKVSGLVIVITPEKVSLPLDTPKE